MTEPIHIAAVQLPPPSCRWTYALIRDRLGALLWNRHVCERLVPPMSDAWMVAHYYLPPPVTGLKRLKLWWKQSSWARARSKAA